MPHFTDQDKLKAHLNAAEIDALFANIPEAERERPFTEADALITAKAGVAPAETNHPILTSIASRIVILAISGQQQWNDSNRAELERRQNEAKEAHAQLEQIASGELLLETPESTTGPEFSSSGRRTEDW